MTRSERYDAMVNEFFGGVASCDDRGCLDTGKAIERYALVTEDAEDIWLTTHSSLRAALAYAADDGTAYANHWTPVQLVDLDTGKVATLAEVPRRFKVTLWGIVDA